MVEGKNDTIQPVQLDEAYGSVEKIDDAANREFYGDSVSDSYRLKSELVSKCLEEIVTGFGWMTDNFWSQGIGTVQPLIKLEFSDITMISYSSVTYYVGLIVGAFFWGISADFIGRKPAFKATLLIGGISACAAAGRQNFTAFSYIWSVIGTAAGGNVPVDSLIFLGFMPGSHQWLLTALSAWWNFGQVIASLLGWVFQANFSCTAVSTWEICKRSDNMEGRYLHITLGALTLAFAFIRIVVFKMPESLSYLLSKGRNAEAVDAINFVARRNREPEPLTLDMLQDIDAQLGLAINSKKRDGAYHVLK